jgi:uncharacterized protein
MRALEDAVLLRVFISENDTCRDIPLYEAIVLRAREMHLAGASVLRGAIGFGRSSHVHGTKLMSISQDLPVVIEIVDCQDKITAFLQTLDEMMPEGLITVEKAGVVRYGPPAAN